ncbi:NAD(P)/FAD-dependent oxidoreductase [Geomicrobium sp. JSM 1781026]|uniref:NAD(P)/FAD-dependent oxidoreductase n=1 Tax=Geomicrobium sp. JSM 1781026 TaxID=3344580 RepID=UPI0035BFCB75
MKFVDVIIIGGGASGSAAALTLGRSRQHVLLFDNDTNRNRVTRESHNFITRDGMSPVAFREQAQLDALAYPTVKKISATVASATKIRDRFEVSTEEGEVFVAKRILIATGVQEVFSHEQIRTYYGTSIFGCPFCDGYELRDQPLAVFADDEAAILHLTKLLSNWSADLVVFTNGKAVDKEAVKPLTEQGMTIQTNPISQLHGEDGKLSSVELQNGEKIVRRGGFVVPEYVRANPFAEQLHLERNERDEIITDGFGRTNVLGVHIAGETEKKASSSLLMASTTGNMAASMMVMDIANERFS